VRGETTARMQAPRDAAQWAQEWPE